MHKLFESLDLILFFHKIPTPESRKEWLQKHVPSLKEEYIGDFTRVPTSPYRNFEGVGFIYPCFTSPRNNRFNSLDFGALYVAKDKETSFDEICHHLKKEIDEADPEHESLDRLLLDVHIDGSFHNVVNKLWKYPYAYDSDPSYKNPQAFGKFLKEEHASQGIAYSSTRRKKGKGECLAVFNEATIHRCTVRSTIWFEWDTKQKTYNPREISSSQQP